MSPTLKTKQRKAKPNKQTKKLQNSKQNKMKMKPNQTKVNVWEGSSGGNCWVLACFWHVFGAILFREPEFSLYPFLYSSLSFCKMEK